jgi:hypothetical protein
VGVEDDLGQAEPNPDEMALGARIAELAQDPSDGARARIMAAVRNAPTPATATRRRIAGGSRWRPVLVGFGTAALLLFASVGALAASSDALPNSPAYKLRLFEENVRVAVADPREKPRLHLQFAAERVRQAKEQIRRGGARVAAELLSDCKHDLAEAEAELLATDDPAEERALEEEHDRVESDAVIQQAQVETIVDRGGAGSPTLEPNIPSREVPVVPAPQATSSPPTEPVPSPDTSPSPFPDSTPAAPVDANPTP